MMLLQLAWRNLWRNRTRSLTIMFSVAIGALAGAFLVSLYYGMGESRLRTALNREISHLQIHHPDFISDNEPQFGFSLAVADSVLKNNPRVRHYALRSLVNGMLANATSTNGVRIYGIDPVQEDSLRGLSDFVQEGGAYFDPEKKGQILLGTRLAEKMGIRVGGKVVLSFTDTAGNIAAGAFRVCGFYKTSNGPLDELNVYVRRTELAHLLGNPEEAQEAAVMLHDLGALDAAVGDFKAALPGLAVQPWQEIAPEISLTIDSLDVASLIMLVIIFLALAFGIVNTMLMAVLERTREIGVMGALGMNKFRLFGMIQLETLFLTLAGAPFGMGVAFLIIGWLGRKGIDLSAIAGNVMSEFGYENIIYPFLPTRNVGQILAIVLVTALLSGVFPALKALSLRPAEAIRRI